MFYTEQMPKYDTMTIPGVNYELNMYCKADKDLKDYPHLRFTVYTVQLTIYVLAQARLPMTVSQILRSLLPSCQSSQWIIKMSNIVSYCVLYRV